jgi:hypothetical protein
MTASKTRAQRLAMPLARDVVRELAVSNGACVRPVQLRRTDLDTGHAEPVLVPHRATPSRRCARPARSGRKRCVPPSAAKAGT